MSVLIMAVLYSGGDQGELLRAAQAPHLGPVLLCLLLQSAVASATALDHPDPAVDLALGPAPGPTRDPGLAHALQSQTGAKTGTG